MNNLEAMLTTPLGFGIVGAIALWSALWKLFALYRAASRGDKGWFVALFFLNTVGILEIVYLFVISPRKKSEASL
jgi:methionyl-tRNA synthetase